MRTRTIVTVALLTAAGCGTTGGAPPSKAGDPGATRASAPAPTVTSVPAPVTAAAPPTPRAAPLTRGELEDLASELRRSDAPTRSTQLAHFRPLCDAEGYPLVGNLATKSVDPGPVATFCAGVRSKAAP